MARIPALARLSTRLGFERDWYLIILGAIVGTLTALGALFFSRALEGVDELVHSLAGSSASWFILVLPILGMGLTGVLVHYYAAEAKGHGVPQVLRALIERSGVIPARIGFIKVLASILTVGSGGSAGTEGPIVQIGATAGSVFGQRLGLTRDQLRTLVGCGAAAGISAIFNAPIAGVFFVLEILLRDFSIKTFTPIVVASVFAAVATQAFAGENEAIFQVSASLHDAQFLYIELPTFILLGAICGLVAVGFNLFLHLGEDWFDRLRVHPLLKPIIGAIILSGIGLVSYQLARYYGAGGREAHIPQVFGNGYRIIESLLDPASYNPLNTTNDLPIALPLLLILLVLKGIATTATLASGGSGGVFAPSLFLGAVAGASLGVGLDRVGLIPAGSTPAAYALVGMAAVVAGTTHAPLTAILILFELTRNIYVVLPIMLAAVVATVIAQLIEPDSIYTYKLRRMGVRVGASRDLTVLRRITAGDCEMVPLPEERVYPSDPLAKLISLQARSELPDFVVVDEDGRYVGMVTGADIRTALIDREAIPLLLVAELIRSDLPTIEPGETLESVLDKFARADTASLCVVSPGAEPRPIALLTRGRVMRRYQAELDRI